MLITCHALRQLPAVFALHDEIKAKKRSLKKKGEYDAWIEAKRKERKSEAESTKERVSATWSWVPKYKQYGKIRRREIQAELWRQEVEFMEIRRDA